MLNDFKTVGADSISALLDSKTNVESQRAEMDSQRAEMDSAPTNENKIINMPIKGTHEWCPYNQIYMIFRVKYLQY